MRRALPLVSGVTVGAAIAAVAFLVIGLPLPSLLVTAALAIIAVRLLLPWHP